MILWLLIGITGGVVLTVGSFLLYLWNWSRDVRSPSPRALNDLYPAEIKEIRDEAKLEVLRTAAKALNLPVEDIRLRAFEEEEK